MNDQPIAIGDLDRDAARAHYERLRERLRDRLVLRRAEHAGVLNRAGFRLIDRARLEAHVELGRLRDGRR